MERESLLKKIRYLGCSWPHGYSHLRLDLKVMGNPAGTDTDLEALKKIPATLSFSVDDHERFSDQYSQLRMTRKEMMYFFKHDVIVVESAKNQDAPETRRIVRCISLIDVAAAWLTAVTGNKKSSLYAITLEESLKRIYAVAYFFKGFVDKFMNKSDFRTRRQRKT